MNINKWIEENTIGGGCQEHDPCLMEKDTVCVDSLREFMKGNVLVEKLDLVRLVRMTNGKFNDDQLETLFKVRKLLEMPEEYVSNEALQQSTPTPLVQTDGVKV